MSKKILIFLKKFWLFFLETFFPRFCVNCEKEGRYICDQCSMFLSEASFICPACQNPSYLGKKHENCKENKMDGLISVWDYDGIVKEAVHLIKFNGFFHITEELIERILLLIEKDETRFSIFLNLLISPKTYITFVPLSKSREKERGFNQSKVLAEYIAKTAGKKTINLLERTKNTKPQTELKKKERFLNIKDTFSFSCQKDLEIEEVLIVDDVWTSGATMKECCRVLKENGVKKVWGFVLAKA